MTDDGRAFISAICVAPDDDTPRLVYADWLDERGESDRATFIRVQCELAKCGPCPATVHHPLTDTPREHHYRRGGPPITPPKDPCGWCPVCLLRRRERELWGEQQIHGWTCHTDDPGQVSMWWPDGVEVDVRGVVRRGFVEELTLSAEDALRVLPELHWGWAGCGRCNHPRDPKAASLIRETDRLLGNRCPACSGTGRVRPSMPCPECKSGKVWFEDQRHGMLINCSACSGSGRVARPCSPHAQPITVVRLTTTPLIGERGWGGFGTVTAVTRRAEAFTCDRFAGITFHLPEMLRGPLVVAGPDGTAPVPASPAPSRRRP